MVTDISVLRNEWIKSLTFTSLFCLAIATATSYVWSAPFYKHVLISLGYGYSAVLGARVLTLIAPDLSPQLMNIISLVFSMLGGSVNAHYWLSDYPQFSTYEDLKPIIMLGFIFTAFCIYCFYAYEKNIYAKHELEKAQRIQSDQEKALVLGELKMLQSQIEPHFLFNTLANINVLIESDPSRAKEMLSRLSDLLRATLRKNRTRFVPLEHELDLLSAYLGIQKIRLGELMNYTIESNELVEALMIPPFLLQPLVENSIVHGIEPRMSRGHIKISIAQNQFEIILEVSDNGVGLINNNSSGGHGIGLQNIRSRLKTLFGNDAKLLVIQNETQGVTSKISINKQVLEKTLNSQYI